MIILAFAKQISPGARRHVRRQKARIRREYTHTDEIRERIEKFYVRFVINKPTIGSDADSRADKLAQSDKKDNPPPKGRGQTK